MNKYTIIIFYGNNWRKEYINADYSKLRKGHIRFYIEVDDGDKLVASYPSNKTAIEKIERKNE